MEQGMEARMYALDPGNVGISHDQFANAFPLLTEHFEEIDANHDGRITLSELQAAWGHGALLRAPRVQ